jgi:hypothetical protein
MTPEEVKQMLKERDEKKKNWLESARNKILEDVEAGKSVLAPTIS